MERYFSQVQHEMELDLRVPAEQQQFYRKQYTDILAKWNNLNETAINVLESCYKLTECNIDYDPSVLTVQISELSGIESTVNYLYSQALSFLDIFIVIHYIPKRQGLSEYDRTVYITARTAEQQALIRDLKAAKEILRNRIISCLSLLKNAKDSE